MCNGSVNAKGRPRIVDRAGRGQMPIGVESFEDVVGSYVYVDKTLALCDLIDRPGMATLFCRPRRFGKSTFMRMCQCFFEAPVEGYVPERAELFDGLAVADRGARYLNEQAAHPVIYLSLNTCAASSLEETLENLAAQVAGEFVRHAYVFDSAALPSFERPKFERLASAAPQVAELRMSLAWLSELLARYHGSKTVILIDEYDAPVSSAHTHGFRERMTEFYRTWLTGALKATTSLFCAVLTGVMRVSRESIFSGLNNITVDTPLDTESAEAFGFTEAEAEALAVFAGRADRVGEMRAWYDGYTFGGARAYNPWSVLNYLRRGVAQPYWTNTGSNSVVRDLIARAGDEATVEFGQLASGGTMSAPVETLAAFEDLGARASALWGLLYLSGYVTTDTTEFPQDESAVRELRCPNLEVRRIFGRDLVERACHMACANERA